MNELIYTVYWIIGLSVSLIITVSLMCYLIVKSLKIEIADLKSKLRQPKEVSLKQIISLLSAYKNTLIKNQDYEKAACIRNAVVELERYYGNKQELPKFESWTITTCYTKDDA